MFRAILATLLILAAPAYSATFRVERDGSAGYTTIQAAVNAAASGDTIRIGAGRFDEGAIVTTPGWTEFVRVLVRQDALTFIGAGESATIIGPTTPWTLAAGDNGGIWAGDAWGSNHLSISGIGFENMGRAILSSDELESLSVSHCRFTSNAISVFLGNSGTLELSDCTFDLSPRDYWQVVASHLRSARVENCEFNLDLNHVWHQVAVQFGATPEVVVANCSFNGGFTALALHYVADATVTNCTFSNQTANDREYAHALYVSASRLHLTDSVFSNQACAVQAGVSPDVEMLRCRVVDASRTSIEFNSFGSLVAHDCVLAKGRRYTVWQRYPCSEGSASKALPRLDMTNNDWGTTSADSIASWIGSCEYDVDYIPFVGQPVWSEPTSWGDLKASFR